VARARIRHRITSRLELTAISMLAQRQTAADMDGLGLEAFVAVGLRSRPNQLLVREPARRELWSGHPGGNLTFADIDQRSRRLACLLSLSRLPERSQALIFTPHGTEQLIAMLGAIRAGLRPFLMPLSAVTASLTKWLDAAGPAVAIATSRCGDIEPAMLLRDAAARSFNARLVCAFGTDAPDGVVPLNNIIANQTQLPAAPVITSPQDALTISAETSHGIRQVMMEREIVAATVEIARVARLSDNQRLLSMMMSPSLCALATGPYLAMLTGAELLPLGLFSLSALWAGLSDGKPTTLIAPAAVENVLRAAGIIGHGSINSVMLVHSALPPKMAAFSGEPGRIIDLFSDRNNLLILMERLPG
jgi:acyl-CoA synthetase (AMP-forming)/AMP-acid ligase II